MKLILIVFFISIFSTQIDSKSLAAIDQDETKKDIFLHPINSSKEDDNSSKKGNISQSEEDEFHPPTNDPPYIFECSKGGLSCSYNIIEKHLLPIFNKFRKELPTIPPSLIIECQDSSEDFPAFFTEEQRKNGAVVISFAIGIYCFTILAIICDSYFLPCVERICEVFNLSQNVAAATFMSIATSTPELFMNLIGTFLTESDIGIGTVVGSSMFNTLGVASLGGLFASAPIKLDWYPVTRDVIMYILSVILLVVMTWDGKIRLYEGMTLFIIYFVYFIMMFQNERISKFIKSKLFKQKSDSVKILTAQSSSASLEVPASLVNAITNSAEYGGNFGNGGCFENTANFGNSSNFTSSTNSSEPSVKSMETNVTMVTLTEEKKPKTRKPWYTWLYDIYTAPIRVLLFCTVPDPKKYPKLFPVTFIICILWIGSNSYLVSWQITVIGQTFGINDAVLGLTFLAAGGCLPEAISISIMSRRGEGSMGVSNALGANTMNILLSLGMPWFVKILILGAKEDSFIRIDSGSIEYTILALIVVALSLYVTLYFNDFHLSRTTGAILLGIYFVFIILAVLSEMVFFDSSRPSCS